MAPVLLLKKKRPKKGISSSGFGNLYYTTMFFVVPLEEFRPS
jgi:hypothetical protein